MHARYALTFGRGAHRHELLQRARQLGLMETDRAALLFVSDRQTPSLCGESAILVGQLFSAANRRLDELPEALRDPADAGDLARPGGLWGNFAFFFSSARGTGVYRDPSAGVGVYRCGDGHDAVFVSDAQLASALGLLDSAAPDPAFAVHWLQFPFLRSARTGLRHVREILPGTLCMLDGRQGWTETPAWRPADFIGRRQAILDPLEAATRLRELALAVVPAQLNGGRMVLQLSGGLDSSIIAACLARGGQAFDCVNFATRSPDGDERDFARAVAGLYRLALHELEEPGTARLDPPTILTLRPATNPLLAPFDSAIAGAAAELGANLLVDGAGGDNLFCYITSAAPVLDALRWGLVGRSIAAVQDIAARADCTWWEVIGATIGRLRPRPAWKEDPSFLVRDALLGKPDPHPWLEGLGSAPPGKRDHVHALVHIQHFLDRRSAGTALSHPLLAQPMLELCLRIPSWLWMGGGRNRAVARDAFRDLLPHSVLARRAKGSLQSLFHRSFGQLRGQLLDLLMSGRLRAERIIDTHRIEAAFGSDGWRRGEVQLRISEIAALELWLQSWSRLSGPPSSVDRPAQDSGAPARWAPA
ncbi:MAG TPA: asparagine synthase-related protein [Sphingomicrobium sp.]|nr:asparagine synthase-related protein [Sphingomicrobium sp.]